MSCKTWEVFHWLEASPPLLLFVFLFHDHRVEPSPLLWASKSKCYDPDKHFHFLFNFHKRDLRLSWLQSYSINLATFTFLSCCDFADVFILLQWSFLGQDVMMIIITISNKSMFFSVQKFTPQPIFPLLLVRFPSKGRPWKIQITENDFLEICHLSIRRIVTQKMLHWGNWAGKRLQRSPGGDSAQSQTFPI